MKLNAGELVAGRYEIDATIGTGGMSVVYRAYDKKLDRPVTLKVLKEDYLADDDLHDKFPQEARAAAALNNQNIVSIFDFGQDGDIFYIVLEYIDGFSLKELITKKAPFDDDIIIAVAMQIAEGLSEAHRNGIVHRDIKPQNILITRSNIVKVADFGIARVAKSSTINAGAGSMGSVHYSSPEQARNGYLDHTTDIYSLGVCMFEMATGRLPFDGEMEVSIAMCHLNNKFPDILEFNPNVSQSVIKIIEKCTEKSSSLRYQRAEDLVHDLKLAQNDPTGQFVTEEIKDTSHGVPVAPVAGVSAPVASASVPVASHGEAPQASFEASFEESFDAPPLEETVAVDPAPVYEAPAYEEPPYEAPAYEDEGYFEEEYPAEEYQEPAPGAFVPPTGPPQKDNLKQRARNDFLSNSQSDDYYQDYSDNSPAPRSDKAVIWGGIFLGLIFVAAISLVGLFVVAPRLGLTNETDNRVFAPNVVGQNLEDAIQMAYDESLVLYIIEEEHSETVPEGYIISQVQTPIFAGLVAGDNLQVVVSLGPEIEYLYTMPNLLGNSIEDIQPTIAHFSIAINIETSYSDTVDYNIVMSQTPVPGTQLHAGSVVVITLSAGPDPDDAYGEGYGNEYGDAYGTDN